MKENGKVVGVDLQLKVTPASMRCAGDVLGMSVWSAACVSRLTLWSCEILSRSTFIPLSRVHFNCTRRRVSQNSFCKCDEERWGAPI